MNKEDILQLIILSIVYSIVSIFAIALFIYFPYIVSLNGMLVSYWFAILTSVYLLDDIIT